MSASAINDQSAYRLGEIADACRIVMLCEDATARDRALEVFNRISNTFDGELKFAVASWDFREMAHHASARAAAEAAEAADIILFSARSSDLPPAISQWLDRIAVNKGTSSGALAFLPVSPAGPPAQFGNIVSELSDAAFRLGLDFIPLSQTPAVRKIQPIPQFAEFNPTPTVNRPLDRLPMDHWGLNE